MLKPVAFANAVTTVFTTAFVICGVVATFLPDLFWGILKAISHSINLEVVRTNEPMSLGTFVFGVILFAVYIWVVTYASVYMYNRYSK